MNGPPPDAASLFRVAPEDFVRERDALARRLVEDGRADDAAAVKRLRKPTLALWSLNRLARDAPEDVAALLTAGGELRAAQQAAVTGGGADRLRAATDERRAIVARLVDAAASALAGLGRDPTGLRDQLATALETASLDPVAGEALAAGLLTEVPSTPAGFGDVFGLSLVPADTTDAKPRRAETVDTAALAKEVERAERAARRDREAAERIATDLADARRRVADLEAAHEEAAARASASAMAAKRAAKARDRATR